MHVAPQPALVFARVTFAICPTGAYCREDRCQSFFKFNLVPTMRAPLEDSEAAGAIRDAGGKAVIIDAPAAALSGEAFLARLRESRPDLIVLVTTFSTLEEDLAWGRRIKSLFPDVPLGIRGAPCFVMDKEILEQNTHIDFCVRGEYEVVFADLVRGGIPRARGVSFRRDGRIVRANDLARVENLDSLPWPDRTAFDPSLYTVRGIGTPQATVRVQRGCPYPCTYCLVHTVSGNQARHRSPRDIAEEIQDIQNQGISSIYLRAETFSLDRAWALAVCHELQQHCPGVRWVTTTRVERVDNDLLAAMRASGCYGVSFGMDVTSPTIAKHVRKLADKEVAARAMRLCDRHGIISLGYIMLGFLWDTEETVAEAEVFVQEVRPDLLTIHFAHPYRGTVYYDEFQKSRQSLVSRRAQAEPATAIQGLSAYDLNHRARRILRKHYLRPRVLASLARKGLPLLAHRFE